MYNTLAKYYDLVFPVNERQTLFLKEETAGLKTALDLGTGTGNTALVLKRLGLEVTALDMSAEMIRLAAAKDPSINFIKGDMLQFLETTSETYDLITCFGNTVPHLTNEQVSTLFHLVKIRLNKGGKFIFQLLNYDRILEKRPEALPLITIDNLLFKREYKYNEHTILFTTRIIQNAILVHDDAVTLFPYRKNDLELKLSELGFKTVYYGQFDFSPWSESSSHLTGVAKIE